MIIKKLLEGKAVNIRSAEIDDAEFILTLRLDPNLNKHIGRTSPSVEDQKEWIRQQQRKSDDFYLILESTNGERIGTGGIYDITDSNFSIGRWIIQKNTAPKIALESIMMVYHFCFFELGLEIANFDVRQENKSVINYHLSYGAEIYKSSESDVYFQFKKADFRKMLLKFERYHSICMDFN